MTNISMYHERLQGWELYPLTYCNNRFFIDDVHDLREALQQKSSTVFVEEESKAEMILLSSHDSRAREGNSTLFTPVFEANLVQRLNPARLSSY